MLKKQPKKSKAELNLERQVKDLNQELKRVNEELKTSEESANDARLYNNRIRNWDNERIRERDQQNAELTSRIVCLNEVIETIGGQLKELRSRFGSMLHDKAMNELNTYKTQTAQKEECDTIHPKVPAGKSISEILRKKKK